LILIIIKVFRKWINLQKIVKGVALGAQSKELVFNVYSWIQKQHAKSGIKWQQYGEAYI
jgi:hypothetical protein